ncbi:MAG: high frequency lysogenization protein HflD [Chloroflexota bacterium]
MMRRIGSALIAVALALLVPAIVLAHPLGNFTINHFAALRIGPSAISLDVVIDRAEIPAFQERQRIDLDGDGTVAPAELEQERQTACGSLASNLRLTADSRVLPLTTVSAGLSLPAGTGGLSTMRLVCEYEAPLAQPIASATSITFDDSSFAERIGWREIVVLGNGTFVSSGTGASAADGLGVSNRLTEYPTDLLAQPLDERSVAVNVSPGGSALVPWSAPDAQPIAGAPASPATTESGSTAGAGAVPGGIAEDLAALVDVTDLTPLAILVSLAIAFALGVVHALSPGHGKTIMAAYLVGAKGSSRQAVGLGLAVTVSHTLGVLVLAGITLAASSVLPPERLYPILGVASGGLVILIGASLLWSRLRAMGLGTRGRAAGFDHAHAHEAGGAHGHEHAHGHPHPHSHAPADTEISWRGLLALGLSGGLVPSASALILLLGSIAAGRVAYGLVLVLGFGLGMAFVLAGIGLLIVHARRLVSRRPSIAGFRRVVAPLQLATASLVVLLGIVLTSQALTQVL